VFELGRALLPYAMPDSHIHVERAERVLGVKDVTLSGLAGSALSLPRVSPVGVPAQVTPLNVTPAAVLQPAEPTVNSWGASGAGPTVKKRRGPLLLIGGAAAVLAGALGLWAARGGVAEQKSAPAASPRAELAKATVAEPIPVPVPVAEPTAPLAVAASSAAPLAAAPPLESASAAPLPIRPKLTVGKPPAPKPEASNPIEKNPEPAPAIAKPSGGITDFGGRR
jgi:hypothetical protein